MITGNALLAPA